VSQVNTNGLWTETGINWNNRPTESADIAFPERQIGSNLVQVDVTSQVLMALSNSVTTMEFRLYKNGGSDVDLLVFNSREVGSTAAPALVASIGPSFPFSFFFLFHKSLFQFHSLLLFFFSFFSFLFHYCCFFFAKTAVIDPFSCFCFFLFFSFFEFFPFSLDLPFQSSTATFDFIPPSSSELPSSLPYTTPLTSSPTSPSSVPPPSSSSSLSFSDTKGTTVSITSEQFSTFFSDGDSSIPYTNLGSSESFEESEGTEEEDNSKDSESGSSNTAGIAVGVTIAILAVVGAGAGTCFLLALFGCFFSFCW
jgi:hypothetical protein